MCWEIATRRAETVMMLFAINSVRQTVFKKSDNEEADKIIRDHVQNSNLRTRVHNFHQFTLFLARWIHHFTSILCVLHTPPII